MSILREVVGNYADFGNVTVQSVSGATFVPIPRYADGQTVTVLESDYMILTTYNGVTNVELPAPETCPGRSLIFRSVHQQGIQSTTANVVPPNCVNSCLAVNIVQNGAQAWAHLVSNGEHWLAVAGNNLYLD